MFRNKRTRRIMVIVDLVVLLLLAAALYFTQTEKAETDGTTDDVSRYYARYIEHDGRLYPVKRGLQSVLLIGTDKLEEGKKPAEVDVFYNDALADFLFLMVFDHEKKTVTPLQINRDTICDVPWLSINGLVGGYVTTQITRAHLFGSGKQDSSRNTVNAVMGLLDDAPVDYYFKFTMDTVPIMNDLVGGVTLTLEDDVPTLGKKYVKGATITLKGQEALRFVRTRSHEDLDANVARMGHHRLYMNAFAAQAKKKIDRNPEFVLDALEKVEKFLNTDMTAEQISHFVDDYYDYEVLPLLTPKGTYTLQTYDNTAEFHADEESVWDCVRRAYCP